MNAPATRPETHQLARSEDRPPYHVTPYAPSGRDLVLQSSNLDAIVRVAQFMAAAGTAVPKYLRKNEGACVAVTMQAMRWNVDPFALAAKTYQVDDNPIAYEGQAIISALNNSPLLATRLDFKWEGPWERIIGRFEWRESKKKMDEHGQPKKYLAPLWGDKDEDGLKIIVWATLVGENKPRELELFLKQARVRNSPLWTEDPRQQLAYLAGRRWGRLHAPDVIMGVYTPEELREIKYMGDADVVEEVPPELLKAGQEAAEKGQAAYAAWWRALREEDRELLLYDPRHDAFKEHAKQVDAAKQGKGATASGPGPTPAPTPAATPAPMTAAQQADKDTGEIAAPAPPAGESDSVPTLAQLVQSIATADNDNVLLMVEDWLPELPREQVDGLKKLIAEQRTKLGTTQPKE